MLTRILRLVEYVTRRRVAKTHEWEMMNIREDKISEFGIVRLYDMSSPGSFLTYPWLVVDGLDGKARVFRTRTAAIQWITWLLNVEKDEGRATEYPPHLIGSSSPTFDVTTAFLGSEE